MASTRPRPAYTWRNPVAAKRFAAWLFDGAPEPPARWLDKDDDEREADASKNTTPVRGG